MKQLILLILSCFAFTSCSISHKATKQKEQVKSEVSAKSETHTAAAETTHTVTIKTTETPADTNKHSSFIHKDDSTQVAENGNQKVVATIIGGVLKNINVFNKPKKAVETTVVDQTKKTQADTKTDTRVKSELNSKKKDSKTDMKSMSGFIIFCFIAFTVLFYFLIKRYKI